MNLSRKKLEPFGAPVIIILTMAVCDISEAQGQDATPALAGPTYSDDLSTYAEVGLRWTRGPSVRDMARHHQVSTRDYPNRGLAELGCTPDERGRLACDVLYEDPLDMGYGRAALRVMGPVRVATIDGTSPAGRTFGFRLRFGRWPEGLIPDHFHPLDQNLRWVRRPSLGEWEMIGVAKDETVTASFNCTAQADGSLACIHTGDPADNVGLVDAALLSLRYARVTRVDDQPLEGSPLHWTFRITRQTP